MKRVSLSLLSLLLVLLFSLSSCSSPSSNPNVQTPATTNQPSPEDPNAPKAPSDATEREKLMIYRDGVALAESGYSYTDWKGASSSRQINGVYYYGATVKQIVKTDISNCKGAFLEAMDGYVSYVDDIGQLFMASYVAESGVYQSVALNGKAVYGGVFGSKYNKGVTKVYLVTTAASFEVEIQKDGKKIGALKLSDFMVKTTVGEKKVSTAMFDGSFLYNSGSNTYTGRFLGIDYATMLQKLKGMNLDIGSKLKQVEYYGVNGLGKVGKNTEYSLDVKNDKYYGSVHFYCMYDGKTYNRDTADTPIGLSVFINGTGSRWMTLNLSKINFITQ